MTVTLYGITSCDTVRRARAWLDEHGVDAVFHDFKTRGLAPAVLDRWVDAVGWEALLNRRGTTWRRLDDTARAAVTDAATAKALMHTHTSLIRRPVIDWGAAANDRITVGFDPERWPVAR